MTFDHFSEAGHKSPDLNELLRDLKVQVRSSVLAPEEVGQLVESLNDASVDLVGSTVEVDCGWAEYIGDGDRVGSSRHELARRVNVNNSGVVIRAPFKRFDVLRHVEKLETSGRLLEIDEPCVVLQNLTLNTYPAPVVNETYIPIVSLGSEISVLLPRLTDM